MIRPRARQRRPHGRVEAQADADAAQRARRKDERHATDSQRVPAEFTRSGQCRRRRPAPARGPAVLSTHEGDEDKRGNVGRPDQSDPRADRSRFHLLQARPRSSLRSRRRRSRFVTNRGLSSSGCSARTGPRRRWVGQPRARRNSVGETQAAPQQIDAQAQYRDTDGPGCISSCWRPSVQGRLRAIAAHLDDPPATVITATIVGEEKRLRHRRVCRYRRFGFATNNAAAVRPPAADRWWRSEPRTAHAAMTISQ